MKIKLKKKWSRAKTDENGVIVGWDDFKVGDVVPVSKAVVKQLHPDMFDVVKEKKANDSR